MPNAAVPLEMSIDSSGCLVTTVSPRLGVGDRLHREQGGLGLHVVDVGGIVDARLPHRPANALCDLLHHGRSTDVLGEDLVAHRDPDRQAGLVGRLAVGDREDRGMRAEHAVGSSRPDHRDRLHLLDRTRTVPEEDIAERLIGQDAGKVVDSAVALGLADDGEHPVGTHVPVLDQALQARGIGHTLQDDLVDRDGHRLTPRLRRPVIFAEATSGAVGLKDSAAGTC